jgi:hypothetical protein
LFEGFWKTGEKKRGRSRGREEIGRKLEEIEERR